MSREIVSNPGGWSRSLPGHTVEYESGFAQPFYDGSTIGLNSGAYGRYTLSILDIEHIYFADMVSVTPQAYKEFFVVVYVNTVPFVGASGIGWLNIPLRQNPSIQFITGDTMYVDIVNLAPEAHNFLIKVNGTKIARPSNFGHAPGAYFTLDDYSIAVGGHVHFTDGTGNSPTSWDWDFGDGSPHSIEQNPVHTYLTAGSYYPKLKATNQYGWDTFAWSTPVVVS